MHGIWGEYPIAYPFSTTLTGQPEPLPELVEGVGEGKKVPKRVRFDISTSSIQAYSASGLGKFLCTVAGTIDVNYLLLPVITGERE